MFESLSEKLSGILDKLTGRGALSEEDVNAAMREVRRALLEADVALEVVRSFVDRARTRAVGAAVIKSVKPGQMVVKIVHDSLVETLGTDSQAIDLTAPAPVARTSGTTPRMKAKDVIVMGRRRSRDASTAASARDLPPRCNCWANSTTRMAFLHASPTKTTRPICTKMLTESFVTHTPAKAQSRHSGTTRMTARGMVQLS